LSENPITNYLFVCLQAICIFSGLIPDPYFSGTTAASLYPVATTLVNVKTYADSTILLGLSLKSDLQSLKLSFSHCIYTALIFHHPRGRPLKLGLV